MPCADNSARRTRFPIGTLALLVALIAWGLQYKTSLILADQDDSLCRTLLLPAKILIDTEDSLPTKIAVSSSASSAVRSIPNLHFLVALSSGDSEPGGRLLLPASQPDAPGHYFSRRFFIRPPPPR
jgi:hypothetical protein